MLHPAQDRLLLDTGNHYQVTRQEDFPQDPTVWNGVLDKTKKKKKKTKDKKDESGTPREYRGYKKWSQLPVAIQVHLIKHCVHFKTKYLGQFHSAA